MPANRLLDRELDEGWKVTKLLHPKPNSTGGCFSVRYEVTDKTGRKAFLKAMDFSSAIQQSNPTVALQSALEEYNFERNLYELCKENRMSRIVTPITSGSVQTDVPGLEGRVFYIIFELAIGDLRCEENREKLSDLSWILKLLHHTAVGLKQLHSKEIVHQDLKPSNVLIFSDNGSKITDLGRSSAKNIPFKWDTSVHPGDLNHAPIEKLFKVKCDDFLDRYATDMYLLGSLFYFHFIDMSATNALLTKLSSYEIDFSNMSFSQALPYIYNAFNETLLDIEIALEKYQTKLVSEIIGLIKELCHPVPSERGKKDSGSRRSQYSLERYVSKLDLLSRKANMERYVNSY